MATPVAIPPHDEAREELRQRLAGWSSWLLNVLGLAMLAIVIVDVTVDLPPAWIGRVHRLGIEIWVLFALLFLVQLALAPAKLSFLKHHWLLALSVVMPALRIVHVLRALAALRAVGAAPGLAGVNSATRTIERVMRRHQVGRAMALTAGVTMLGAVGLMGLEGVGAGHFGTALWWSAAFVTTVGSDFQPRTLEGRVVALLLVVWGLGVVGYVTAAIASTLVGEGSTAAPRSPDAATSDAGEDLRQLRQEVAEVRSMLAQLLAQEGANRMPAPPPADAGRPSHVS